VELTEDKGLATEMAQEIRKLNGRVAALEAASAGKERLSDSTISSSWHSAPDTAEAWKQVLASEARKLMQALEGLPELLDACVKAGRLFQECEGELQKAMDDADGSAGAGGALTQKGNNKDEGIWEREYRDMQESAIEIQCHMMADLQRANAEVCLCIGQRLCERAFFGCERRGGGGGIVCVYMRACV